MVTLSNASAHELNVGVLCVNVDNGYKNQLHAGEKYYITIGDYYKGGLGHGYGTIKKGLDISWVWSVNGTGTPKVRRVNSATVNRYGKEVNLKYHTKNSGNEQKCFRRYNC